MKKTNPRLIFIFSAATLMIIILLTASALSSCGNDDKGREPFSPENGGYEIMLNPDDWSEVMLSIEYSPDQLGLLNTPLGFMLTVDSYKKSDMIYLDVSDMTGFMDFYKTLDAPKNIYEPADGKSFGGLTDIAAKIIKGSVFKSGKKQEIYAPERICEFIYLENDDYYFALSYVCFEDKFSDGQKAVNDIISRLIIK